MIIIANDDGCAVYFPCDAVTCRDLQDRVLEHDDGRHGGRSVLHSLLRDARCATSP